MRIAKAFATHRTHPGGEFCSLYVAVGQKISYNMYYQRIFLKGTSRSLCSGHAITDHVRSLNLFTDPIWVAPTP